MSAAEPVKYVLQYGPNNSVTARPVISPNSGQQQQPGTHRPVQLVPTSAPGSRLMQPTSAVTPNGGRQNVIIVAPNNKIKTSPTTGWWNEVSASNNNIVVNLKPGGASPRVRTPINHHKLPPPFSIPGHQQQQPIRLLSPEELLPKGSSISAAAAQSHRHPPPPKRAPERVAIIPSHLPHAGLTHSGGPSNHTGAHNPPPHIHSTRNALLPPRAASPDVPVAPPTSELVNGVFNAYIDIRNVVASFQVRCHLNLRKVALNAINVEYRRERGRVLMKLRKPRITANIWSSGRITCTGAKSVSEAKKGCRRVARILQKCGFQVKYCKFKVNNVLATTSFPFGVKLASLSNGNKDVQYEPELHPAAVVRFPEKSNNMTAKVFSTGSVTITAHTVQATEDCVVLLYPVVEPHKTAKPAAPPAGRTAAAAPQAKRQRMEDYLGNGSDDSQSDSEDADSD